VGHYPVIFLKKIKKFEVKLKNPNILVIDKKGRVMIPSHIRDYLGIGKYTKLVITADKKEIKLLPINLEAEAVREDWRIFSINKKTNVTKIRQNFEKQAKEEILMFCGDGSFLEEDFFVLKNITKNGVKIKILMKENKSKELVKKLSKVGAKIKIGYNGVMRGNIIDERIITIAIKSANKKMLSYKALVTTNLTLVKTLSDYFRLWWDRL